MNKWFRVCGTVLSAGDARRPVKVSLADMRCVGLGGRESIAGAEAIVIQVIALRSGAIIQHVPKCVKLCPRPAT